MSEPTKYPELQTKADEIARQTLETIDRQAKGVKSAMPYKAQWILEETIKILERSV